MRQNNRLAMHRHGRVPLLRGPSEATVGAVPMCRRWPLNRSRTRRASMVTVGALAALGRYEDRPEQEPGARGVPAHGLIGRRSDRLCGNNSRILGRIGSIPVSRYLIAGSVSQDNACQLSSAQSGGGILGSSGPTVRLVPPCPRPT